MSHVSTWMGDRLGIHGAVDIFPQLKQADFPHFFSTLMTSLSSDGIPNPILSRGTVTMSSSLI